MNTSEEDNQKSSLYVLLTGLGMGAADVVPGVSGGTVAFVMGIYDQLLNAIKSVNLDFFRKILKLEFRSAMEQIPWGFLIPLVSGIAISILSLAKLLEYLLTEHEVYLMSFFFGLILASIVALSVRTKWSAREIAGLVAGTIFAYWLVGLVPADPGHSALILFVSGILAISAMILPGISGSFILLILGQYLHCVSTLNLMIDALKSGQFNTFFAHFFTTVLPVGIGAVLGLMLFSRFLSWLLNSYRTVTVAILVGCMIGSLRKIWPYKLIHSTYVDRHGNELPKEWENVLPSLNVSVLGAAALLLLGFLFLCFVDHIHDRGNPIARLILSRRNSAAS